MAIKRENTSDGVKLRDTKTGNLVGSVPKGVKAPEPVELPSVEMPAIPADSPEVDVWARWESSEKARRLTEARKPPAEDWQEKVSAGFVGYFEKTVKYPGFDPSSSQVSKPLNVLMRDALDGFKRTFYGLVDSGVNEEDAKTWYELQRMKVEFLQHYRWGPLLDCATLDEDDEDAWSPTWNGHRAVNEVKDVIATVFDDNVGYEELSAGSS